MNLTTEDEQLMHSAAAEIMSLRRQNELMGAQLSIVETFRAALLGPRQGGGMMAEDIAHKLHMRVAKSREGREE